jgi:hypothetical protein
MADPQQLARETGNLDEHQWRVFLEELGEVRRRRNQLAAEGPPRNGSRDELAAWVAREHLAMDPGITDVWYLPANAPPDEIRLIEVNQFLSGLNDQAVSPVDFGMDIAGAEFRLLVADLTPEQGKHLLEGKLTLPGNWTLRNAKHFS